VGREPELIRSRQTHDPLKFSSRLIPVPFYCHEATTPERLVRAVVCSSTTSRSPLHEQPPTKQRPAPQPRWERQSWQRSLGKPRPDDVSLYVHIFPSAARLLVLRCNRESPTPGTSAHRWWPPTLTPTCGLWPGNWTLSRAKCSEPALVAKANCDWADGEQQTRSDYSALSTQTGPQLFGALIEQQNSAWSTRPGKPRSRGSPRVPLRRPRWMVHGRHKGPDAGARGFKRFITCIAGTPLPGATGAVNPRLGAVDQACDGRWPGCWETESFESVNGILESVRLDSCHFRLRSTSLYLDDRPYVEGLQSPDRGYRMRLDHSQTLH